MCGKISVLAARGLQTCDAQALTTDCAEGSRTGGSETHHYGPTSFCNLYIQPHASAHTKTPLSDYRRPLPPHIFPSVHPLTPRPLISNTTTRIGSKIIATICTYEPHFNNAQCKVHRAAILMV